MRTIRAVFPFPYIRITTMYGIHILGTTRVLTGIMITPIFHCGTLGIDSDFIGTGEQLGGGITDIIARGTNITTTGGINLHRRNGMKNSARGREIMTGDEVS